MSPEIFMQNALVPALALLPEKMNSQPAKAIILTICLQESRLKYRRQIGGPARSYAMFEQGGGIQGVLTHPAVKAYTQTALTELDYAYDSDAAACYVAIEHNDILAAVFARLLLYTLPDALPGRAAPGTGWSQYLRAWRPGKPHRATWDDFYSAAWEIVSDH